MTPEDYCLDHAAPAGSLIYYVLRFTPAQQRGVLAALFALQATLEETAREAHDAEVARQRLLWWQSELNGALAGNATHPITRALRIPDGTLALDAALFQELIEGHLTDLDGGGFGQFRDLSLHCYRTSASVTLLACEALGYSQRETRKFAHELGIALQLTRILGNLGRTLRQQRADLPLDEMQQFGVDPRDLLQPVPPAGLLPLLEHQQQRAALTFTRAEQLLPPADAKSQIPLRILGRLHERLLDEIRREGPAIVHRQVSLTPLRQLWIAWRTAQNSGTRAK